MLWSSWNTEVLWLLCYTSWICQTLQLWVVLTSHLLILGFLRGCPSDVCSGCGCLRKPSSESGHCLQSRLMSDINTAVMPFSEGHVGLGSAPAIRELPQPGWRHSQGVKRLARPWQELESQDRELQHSARAIPEIWTEGLDTPCLASSAAQAGTRFPSNGSSHGKENLLPEPLVKLAFATLSYKGHFKKEHPWKKFGYLLGNKGKLYLNRSWGGSRNRFYFCFNLH